MSEAFGLAKEKYGEIGVDVEIAMARLKDVPISLHCWQGDGFTLSSADDGVRRFWIDHGRACRKIGAHMGEALGSPCVVNVWIPDGDKDTPIDRKGPRERLKSSLDQMFAEQMSPKHLLDAIECKLFGIGSESYVVDLARSMGVGRFGILLSGSQEFYMGYAIANFLSRTPGQLALHS